MILYLHDQRQQLSLLPSLAFSPLPGLLIHDKSQKFIGLALRGRSMHAHTLIAVCYVQRKMHHMMYIQITLGMVSLILRFTVTQTSSSWSIDFLFISCSSQGPH
mmetsp:Transcript_14761/g.21824  ORF Transcript_14761/g.21824 Transcript_14761/m.21824 type:complete len:104 (-) Transcript_14761:39-350(-)